MSNKVLTRVRDGYTYAGDTDLRIMTCPYCGVVYAIPRTLQHHAYERGDFKIMWYCPNGHHLGYGEGDVDRERKARQWAEQRLTAERDLREDTERRLAAQKGATTRARKRAAAALCPCCNRSFVQLRRHMEAKHPDYVPDNRI